MDKKAPAGDLTTAEGSVYNDLDKAPVVLAGEQCADLWSDGAHCSFLLALKHGDPVADGFRSRLFVTLAIVIQNGKGLIVKADMDGI